MDNHKPVYCRECRTANSFVLYPEADVKTESGQSFMIGWICKCCGNTVITTNPEYKPLVEV